MGRLLGEMDEWEEFGSKLYWIPVGPWEEGRMAAFCLNQSRRKS